MNSCTEHFARIQSFIDGELTKEESESLLSHHRQCTRCAAAMEETEALSSLIRAARPQIAAPPSLRAAVLQNMRSNNAAARHPKSQPVKKSARIRIWSTHVMAAMLLMAVAGAFTPAMQRQSRAASPAGTAILLTSSHYRATSSTLQVMSLPSSKTLTKNEIHMIPEDSCRQYP